VSCAPRQRIERTPSQISVQAVDHLLIRIYLDGTACVDAGGGDRAVKPGDFTVFDLSQVMRSDTGEIANINLLMPRRSLDRRLGDLSPLHGRVFRQDLTPLTQLMGITSAALRPASRRPMHGSGTACPSRPSPSATPC